MYLDIGIICKDALGAWLNIDLCSSLVNKILDSFRCQRWSSFPTTFVFTPDTNTKKACSWSIVTRTPHIWIGGDRSITKLSCKCIRLPCSWKYTSETNHKALILFERKRSTQICTKQYPSVWYTLSLRAWERRGIMRSGEGCGDGFTTAIRIPSHSAVR